MAKSSRELGLFLPPEKERQLRELEGLEEEQKSRLRRRMMFRWMGWGAVMVLLGQWSIGFLSFFTPKRLGAFGGTVVAGQVADFKVGDVKQVRDGKFYLTRVPEGFFALYWKCPHLGCTVPWAPQDPAPRPMDRFPVKIDGTGRINVETGPSKAISRPVADAADAVTPPA